MFIGCLSENPQSFEMSRNPGSVSSLLTSLTQHRGLMHWRAAMVLFSQCFVGEMAVENDTKLLVMGPPSNAKNDFKTNTSMEYLCKK